MINALKTLALIVCGIALVTAIDYCTSWAHRNSGECGGASGCSWAWCEHYDGRDHLHDCNL